MLAAGRAGQFPADRPTPPAAGPAAERGALSLALVLALAPLPAGVVTTEDPTAPPAPSIAPLALPAISWPDLLALLRQRHPAYVPGWHDEVLVIEHRESVCTRAIAAATVGPATLEGDAARLLLLIGWMASGDPPPVHGGILSTLEGSSAEMTPPPPRSLRLVLPAATSLRTALNLLVRENRNGVWIAWQRARADGAVGCRLAAYYAGGLVATSTADFAVVP